MYNQNNRTAAALLCGLLGCLCFGAGDWLMLYGNTAHHGSLSWLKDGAFRLGFTNGLMSESMALWFGSMQLWLRGQKANHAGRDS